MNNQNYSPWPQQQQKPKGGGLFGGGGGKEMSTRDIIAIALSSLGDSIGEHTNGIKGQSLNGLMKRFQDHSDQAAKQEEEERARRAGLGVGHTPQQMEAILAGIPLPQGPKPGSFEWWQTASDDQRKVFDDYNPETVATANGPVRVPRNRPEIGKIVPNDQLGGAPNPAPPEPPQHRVVTSRAQYNEMVRQKGKAWTDNYLRSYNVTIED